MGYSPEQILKSIELAERFASQDSEAEQARGALGQAIEKTIPGFLERRATETGGLHAELMDDPLAVALLPQAREIIRIVAERKKVIEKTFFGALGFAIAAQMIVERGEEVPGGNTAPFDDAFYNEFWMEFLGALQSGNRATALGALDVLLRRAEDDFARVNLPVVPNYQPPE